MAIPKDQFHAGSRSHVLLAACGAKEVAKEPGGRGAFTTALLEVLRSVRPDALTYMGIMDRLPAIPDQTPQCEGQNKGLVLFGAKVAGADRQFVRVLKTGDTYMLQAGAAQGIEVGAQFDVHAGCVLSGNSNPALASFTVRSVGPFRSELEPTGPIPAYLPSPLYGRQTMEGKNYELKVFFTNAFVEIMGRDMDGWRGGLTGSGGAAEFGYAKAESEAGLVVGLERGYAVYETRHKEVNASGLVRIPHTTGTTAKEVLPVIRAAAKWNWHANRTNADDPFKGQVRIEMKRLDRRDGGPPGPVGDDLNSGGVAEVIANDEQLYGFRLVNESKYDLYPYLFYFDANDLSVEGYYLGSHGGIAGCDAQLLGKGPNGTWPAGELTLGYGPNNASPLNMLLPPNEDRGVIIFKLFVTTSATDFTLLEQSSPFLGGRKMTKAAYNTLEKKDLWGTSMMIVSCGRKPLQLHTWRDGIDMDKALREHLVGRSSSPLIIKSIGAIPERRAWFQTTPISANRLAVIRNVRLRTLARDQGQYGAAKNKHYSSFDLAILDSKGRVKLSPSTQKPCTWQSHANQPNSKQYVWVDGLVFDEYHELWRHIEPGDSLQVVMCAQTKNCINDAAEGHFMFW
ncbi:ICE-like protease (caspase) p20 domain protein [Ceratobasidium sp. AG-Ba]|nr:ICE-like protease (caspase) p20 domain protein [Ceratobasidium sp. AG-Ba]